MLQLAIIHAREKLTDTTLCWTATVERGLLAKWAGWKESESSKWLLPGFTEASEQEPAIARGGTLLRLTLPAAASLSEAMAGGLYVGCAVRASYFVRGDGDPKAAVLLNGTPVLVTEAKMQDGVMTVAAHVDTIALRRYFSIFYTVD
jgi:hypothetical protein